MDHNDHCALIKDGIPTSSGVWADFGSGDGAFTRALAEILRPGSRIHSVDKSAASLRRQEWAMRIQFPKIDVQYLHADYTRPLDLLPLGALYLGGNADLYVLFDPSAETVRLVPVGSSRVEMVDQVVCP